MQQFEFETYHKYIQLIQMYLIQQNIAYGKITKKHFSSICSSIKERLFEHLWKV